MNLADTRAYFDFLEPRNNELFNFCLLDIDGKKPLPGLGVNWGIKDEILDACATETRPFTLHVTLNRTNLKGRKIRDIESTRVFCVDIDVHTEPERIKQFIADYDIGMVVQSSQSPSKWHLYWRCVPIPLAEWSRIQTGVAYAFSGDDADFNMADWNHTIRVPGIDRRQKDGGMFTPRIVWLNPDAPEYTQLSFRERFPWIDEQIKGGEEARRAKFQAIRDVVKGINKATHSPELMLKALGEGDRNVTMYSILRAFKVANPLSTLDEMRTLAHRLNNDLETNHPKRGLYVEELLRIVDSAQRHGEIAIENAAIRAAKAEAHRENVLSLIGVIPDEPETPQPAQVEYVPVQELIDGVAAVTAASEHLKDKLAEAAGLKAAAEILEKPEPPKASTKKVDPESAAKAKHYTQTEKPAFPYNYETSDLKHRFTDVAVAERVLQRFGTEIVRLPSGVFAFNETKGDWNIQAPDTSPELTGFAKACAYDTVADERFVDELCLTDKGEFSHTKHKKAIERFISAGMFSGVRGLVRNSTDVLSGSSDMFDAVEHLVICNGEVVNLLDGTTRRPVAQDYMMNANSVVYDPKATCPRWLEFLREVFAENGDVGSSISFLQELFGYSLSASIREQKVFVHYGDGANGKSKVLSALVKLSGQSCTFIDSDEMAVKKGTFIRDFELFGAKIEGKRVAIIDDMDTKTGWNEGLLKSMTADTVRARGKFEKSREFRNRCKMHVGTNRIPEAPSENNGLIRRICIIDYKRVFEENTAKNAEIDAMITEELAGIFNWAHMGYARMFARGGLRYPEETRAAIAEYKSEVFRVETALLDLYVVGSSLSDKSEWQFLHDIVSDVQNWIQNNGGASQPVDAKEVATGLKRAFKEQPVKIWDSARGNAFRAYNLQLKNPRKINNLA